jgi:hypothetical protein
VIGDVGLTAQPSDATQRVVADRGPSTFEEFSRPRCAERGACARDPELERERGIVDRGHVRLGCGEDRFGRCVVGAVDLEARLGERGFDHPPRRTRAFAQDAQA